VRRAVKEDVRDLVVLPEIFELGNDAFLRRGTHEYNSYLLSLLTP